MKIIKCTDCGDPCYCNSIEGFIIKSKKEEQQQQQEHIRITWNTLREIDIYDEQYCKRLLKQVVRECLHQSSQIYHIKRLEISGHEKTKEIEQLKFNCWSDCKSKGTHKRGYIKYVESDGWYCTKHYKDNIAMNRKPCTLLTEGLIEAKKMIESNQADSI